MRSIDWMRLGIVEVESNVTNLCTVYVLRSSLTVSAEIIVVI